MARFVTTKLVCESSRDPASSSSSASTRSSAPELHVKVKLRPVPGEFVLMPLLVFGTTRDNSGPRNANDVNPRKFVPNIHARNLDMSLRLLCPREHLQILKFRMVGDPADRGKDLAVL